MPEPTDAFFALCPRGLESLLADELRELGADVDRPIGGGVAFRADTATAYAVNLRSRLASRVLQKVGEARYRNDDDLYKLAARTPWESLVYRNNTLRVDVTAIRSPLRSLNFATLRIKDGIVDRLRKETGERPSIDTREPDTRVFGFLDERHVTLYLDWSGQALFKRGWRSGEDAKGEAPLKENLAAGLLMLAGWTPDMPLYDPFCGSGTILIEAAQMALGIAPGSQRTFAFEKLKGFDAAVWDRVRNAPAMAAGGGRMPQIAGADIDEDALRKARENLRLAGVEAARVRIARGDFAQAKAPFDKPGMIVCNPPYGQRLHLRADAPAAPQGRAGDARPGEGGRHKPVRDLPASAAARGSTDEMGRFAHVLKQQFGGWRVCMMTSDLDLPRQLGMKERRKIPLFNGTLECRLFVFDIFAGGSRAIP